MQKKIARLATLLTFGLMFGLIFFLVKTSGVKAACYCADPIGDNCRCPQSGGKSSNSYSADGVTVYCDNPEEANSYWAVSNTICGTATETVPYCSTWKGDPDTIICWGTGFMLGYSTLGAGYDTGGHTQTWSGGPITYNGHVWSGSDGSGPHSILACEHDNFCCNQSACQDWHPSTPSSCDPQDPSIPPKDWCYRKPGIPGLAPRVDCSKTTDNEFHTFRPYPAEPCDYVAHDLALFCGNTLNIQDAYEVQKQYFTEDEHSERYGDIRWDYLFEETGEVISPISPLAGAGTPIPSPCPTIAGTDPVKELCTFQINPDGSLRSIPFSIDVSDSYLPIMGLTESDYVVNKNNENGSLDDAQKTNEYVSWYLNGVVNNPAEEVYMYPEDAYDEDSEKIKNFSGPLRKLLSHRSQRDTIANEIDGVKEVRHDQIAGFIATIHAAVWDWGRIVTSHDYAGLLDGLKKREYRLSKWAEDWPDPDTSDKIFSKPPKEEDESFNDFIDWLIAYQEWKGDFCFELLETFHLCLDNPFRLNAISDIFYKIPFSSTEDRVGLIQVTSSFFTPMPGTAQAQRITSATVNSDSGYGFPYANLFFAHMQESVELADILQKTYAGKGLELNTPVANVEPNQWCDVRLIRSNPGDSLEADELGGTIDYSSEIDCAFYHVGGGNICKVLGGRCADDFDRCGGPDPFGAPCICDADYERTDCTNSNESCVEGCDNNTSSCGTTPGHWCYPNNWNNCTGVQQLPDYCDDPGTPPEVKDSDECRANYCGGGICATDCDQPHNSVVIEPNPEICAVWTLVSLPTETKTPLADEAWSRLVAGNQAVFKKIYPKIEVGSPVETIWDIPAASPVSFSSPQLYAVTNPATGRDASVPELYFPHIGGIHQYFLKCIQTALRPEGFGESCKVSGPDSIPIMGPLDPNCVGAALTYYMDTVLESAGSLNHIRFLSPAFNLTNPATYDIVNAMTNSGADWASLDALAGNAYNTGSGLVTQHVSNFRTTTGLNKQMMLTETGFMPENPSISALASEMRNLSSVNVFSGLLFNAFGTNPDPNFVHHILSDDQIRQVCGNVACGRIGVNSGIIFHNFDNEDTAYIDRMKRLGMNYTLSIYNGEEATTNAVARFLRAGITPVIRLGAGGNSSGPNPEAYGRYLQDLNNYLNINGIGGQVYVIAGPNEPDIECWAAPQCGCMVGYDGAPQLTIAPTPTPTIGP